MSSIVHYYRKTEPPHSLLPSVKEELKDLGWETESQKIQTIETESCFNVQMTETLTEDQTKKLEWLLSETFDHESLRLEKSAFEAAPSPPAGTNLQLEFGPRMTFTSAFSSNAVSICKSCGLPISRLEQSRRYRLVLTEALEGAAVAVIKGMLHDRMTEQEYAEAITTFDSGASPQPVRTIPIMTEGRAALEKINEEMGLGFDDFDLDYYTNLFKVRTSFRRIDASPFSQIILHELFDKNRKNWAEILPMLNALIWDSRIQNTLAIGSLAAR